MRHRVLAGVAVVVLLAACGGSGGKGIGGGGSTTTGTLHVVNNATVDIDQFYVSPASATSWGSPQNTSPIAASGGIWDLNDIPPDTYDARAKVIGATSTYYAYAMGWALAAGETHPLTTSNSSFTGSFKVVNGSTTAITEVYLSPTSSSTWGANQLTAPIAVGGNFQLTDLPSDTYDLKCVYSGGAYSTGTWPVTSLTLQVVTCS
jgi:hypothetical protein